MVVFFEDRLSNCRLPDTYMSRWQIAIGIGGDQLQKLIFHQVRARQRVQRSSALDMVLCHIASVIPDMLSKQVLAYDKAFEMALVIFIYLYQILHL